VGWLPWLEGTAVATAMRESSWLYPVVEILHILGFVVLVGSAAMWDLRLLGVSRSLPVTLMAGHLLPWARGGLLLAAPTGALLFASDATTIAVNPAFQLKLALIAGAILNAAAFHRWTYRSVRAWDCHVGTPPPAKLAGLLSLSLWAGTVASGRLIAYL
jgi:hypothetical protein